MRDPVTNSVRNQALINWQLVAHLGLSVGLTDWLEAVLVMPVSAQSFTGAFGRYGEPSDPQITRSGFYLVDARTNVPPPDGGPLDMSLGFKARLFRAGNFSMAAVAVATLPFGDEAAFLGDSNATFRPTLVGDFTTRRFSVAANLGAIVRQTTRVYDPYDIIAGSANPRPLLIVGHEITWSAGASYRPLPWMAVVATLYGYHPMGVGPSTNDHTVDLLAGPQFFPSSHVSLSLAGGADILPRANRHDDWRVYFGVAWAPKSVEARRSSEGLRDNDFDGIPNELDRCPDEPEDRDNFQDGDGCPDLDNDGDGIPDLRDRCPDEPEDFDQFDDDDGCPDLDNDGDGLPDAIDRCPNEAETFNGIDDQDGCPDTGVLAQGGPLAPDAPLELNANILFVPGSAALGERNQHELDRIADRLLSTRRGRRVRLEGHTDSREAPKRATTLSQARAEAVRNYLRKKGVAADRLQAVGYGDSRPVVDNNSIDERARNRRVELIVVDQ
jgi:outer membrane protein OmpA-like peptidoglycan-associated protein